MFSLILQRELSELLLRRRRRTGLRERRLTGLRRRGNGDLRPPPPPRKRSGDRFQRFCGGRPLNGGGDGLLIICR